MQIFLALELLFGDKLRLNKQILEAGQLISSAIHQNREIWDLPEGARIYKPSYLKHPVTIWVAEKPKNTVFCIDYMFSLDRKRRELYGSAVHGTCVALEKLKELGTGTYLDSEETLIAYLIKHRISIPIVTPIEGVDLEEIRKRTVRVSRRNIGIKLDIHKRYLTLKHQAGPKPKKRKLEESDDDDDDDEDEDE